MANLIQRIRSGRELERQNPWPTVTFDQLPMWLGQFGYQGLGYGPALIQTYQANREAISADFMGFVKGAYKSNGPVFAIMAFRLLMFSEARFQFRRMINGRPGQLFGTPALEPLEHPWQNGTTGDLLARAITDVDIAGNFYATRVAGPERGQVRIVRLRPDWVTIVLGSMEDTSVATYDPTAELIGYIYNRGGPGSGLTPHLYLPDEVMHFAPYLDPTAHYRGISWIEPVLQEVLGDRAMMAHKLQFFNNAATPNLVVSMDTGKMDRKTFLEWIKLFESEHEGVANAYKTLYLGSGAQATIVGKDLKEVDFKVVQGAGETRLAAAAGVPPVLVGFSEGLASATYSNYAMARRRVADMTFRPLWRNFCGSLETLITPPPGAQLWYDDRDIPFLQEDVKDEAEIALTRSTALKMLTDAGYTGDSAVMAIENNDFTLLEHSGLYSVQLLPPGTTANSNSNGNGPPHGGGTSSNQPGQQPSTLTNGSTPNTPSSGGGGSGSEGSGSGMSSARLPPAIERARLSGNAEDLARAILAAEARGELTPDA